MKKIPKKSAEENYAFIDGQNLNLAIRDSGWKLDFKRFRVYLREKYQVVKAYYFIGFVPGNSELYSALQDFGFNLIFKPTFRNKGGLVKGNVDAELVLQAMIEIPNFRQAVIVTGDGDFYCLVKYLKDEGKLLKVLIPNANKFSGLLKKSAGNSIAFMNELRKKLEYKESKKKRTS